MRKQLAIWIVAFFAIIAINANAQTTLRRRPDSDEDKKAREEYARRNGLQTEQKKIASTNTLGTFPSHFTPQQVAEAIFNRLLTKCGDSYFVIVFRGGKELNELKGKRTVIVEGGRVTPERLSQTDILNGEKPSTVEWMGKTYLKYESSRFWKGSEWSRWGADAPIGPYIFFHKDAGVWKVGGGEVSMTGIDCGILHSSSDSNQ